MLNHAPYNPKDKMIWFHFFILWLGTLRFSKNIKLSLTRVSPKCAYTFYNAFSIRRTWYVDLEQLKPFWRSISIWKNGLFASSSLFINLSMNRQQNLNLSRVRVLLGCWSDVWGFRALIWSQAKLNLSESIRLCNRQESILGFFCSAWRAFASRMFRAGHRIIKKFSF